MPGECLQVALREEEGIRGGVDRDPRLHLARQERAEAEAGQGAEPEQGGVGDQAATIDEIAVPAEKAQV